MTLFDFVKEMKDKKSDKISLKKVEGPNGAFISITKANGEISTLPIGKKSQGGTLDEYNILIAEDGQAICTINNYEDGEELTL